MARDRAFSNAERQAAAIGPTLSITADRVPLERAVMSTQAGSAGRMAVHIPAAGEPGSQPVNIGTRRATQKDLTTTQQLGRASITEVTGGSALLAPTAISTGQIAIVEVFVPEGEVSNGVDTAWLVLAGVGIALIVGSVAVADRLGIRMVQPAQRLAGAAHDLGECKLGARVPEEGPTELRSAAIAFNSMADQVVQLLANERELAADLSHRLRTPLTVLRLNAASLGHGPAADQTRAAVEQLEREVDTITARRARPSRRPRRPPPPPPRRPAAVRAPVRASRRNARFVLPAAEHGDRPVEGRVPSPRELLVREDRFTQMRRDARTVEGRFRTSQELLVRQHELPAAGERAPHHVREDTLRVLPDPDRPAGPFHQRLGEGLTGADRRAAGEHGHRTGVPGRRRGDGQEGAAPVAGLGRCGHVPLVLARGPALVLDVAEHPGRAGDGSERAVRVALVPSLVTRTIRTRNGGRGTGRPTLEEVAARAGVGRGMVSRVINGSPGVSDRTRAVVEAAVAELGYVPNRAAARS